MLLFPDFKKIISIKLFPLPISLYVLLLFATKLVYTPYYTLSNSCLCLSLFMHPPGPPDFSLFMSSMASTFSKCNDCSSPCNNCPIRSFDTLITPSFLIYSLGFKFTTFSWFPSYFTAHGFQSPLLVPPHLLNFWRSLGFRPWSSLSQRTAVFS